jgi:hypothetical protein
VSIKYDNERRYLVRAQNRNKEARQSGKKATLVVEGVE